MDARTLFFLTPTRSAYETMRLPYFPEESEKFSNIVPPKSGYTTKGRMLNEMPSSDADIARCQSPTKLLTPESWVPIKNIPPVTPNPQVIQLWEGKVLSVDHDHCVMEVLLDAKMGNYQSHTGEIELQWVADQDMELVKPGAIFYLTLFKRTKRGGSIENAQELRFRRLPAWTRRQAEQIQHEAETILAKMKTKPIAE